jgi:isopentenyl diphosphate isomerase/L-lactate dehydrogenase-like FMN-dependent dehydrogenase
MASRTSGTLVHRAERAGFKAIVVTLDTWITGWRVTAR